LEPADTLKGKSSKFTHQTFFESLGGQANLTFDLHYSVFNKNTCLGGYFDVASTSHVDMSLEYLNCLC